MIRYGVLGVSLLGWRSWFFGWYILLIEMVNLSFWLAYLVFLSAYILRWRTWCLWHLGWCICNNFYIHWIIWMFGGIKWHFWCPKKKYSITPLNLGKNHIFSTRPIKDMGTPLWENGQREPKHQHNKCCCKFYACSRNIDTLWQLGHKSDNVIYGR